MSQSRKAAPGRIVFFTLGLCAMVMSAACENASPLAPSTTLPVGDAQSVAAESATSNGALVGELARPARAKASHTLADGSWITCELVRQSGNEKFRMTGEVAQAYRNMDLRYLLGGGGVFEIGSTRSSNRGRFRTGWVAVAGIHWAADSDVDCGIIDPVEVRVVGMVAP